MINEKGDLKMKKKVAILIMILAFTFIASNVSMGHTYFRTNECHPLRLCAYALHPIGTALEYGVCRPIHWLVSRKHLRIIFGHNVNEDDKYFEWK